MPFTESDEKTSENNKFWNQSNRAYHTVCTPPKKVSRTTIDSDASTLNNSIEETVQLPNEQQFDIIVTNVNQTILELNEVYNKIGYNADEINNKKSEIFTVIQDTINNFANSLSREKNSIENECEWLRQQIQVILSMINDPSGLKNLTMLERGLIFKDKIMYQQGYKQDLKDKLARKQNFFVSSPFNISQIDNNDEVECSLEQQYEYMSKYIPEVSLLILKAKLNSSFLIVLEAFVKLFSKFNHMNLQFIEVSSYIDRDFESSNKIIKSFPLRDEAEQHRILIQKFERLIKNLNSIDTTYKNNHIDETFILSSPRKPKLNLKNSEESTKVEDNVAELRDVNYQLVRVIRSLKFTKITPDLLTSCQQEIEKCRDEIESRAEKLTEIISNCLSYIEQLQIDDEQLIKLQKQHKLSQDTNDEGYFEIETLTFIKSNPRSFGLNDTHLSFITKFANLLQKIKETKERKKESYLKHCRYLWEKLGENNEYINNFLQANSSLTDISLMNYKMELNKLYLKRSEFIDKFIADSRIEIENLWQKMYYSEDQRTRFEYFDYNPQNETTDKEIILSIHEKEASRLKDLYSSQESIFELYSEFNDLIQDQAFLLESSRDSSRLLSKNSCKILLNEEKMRKKINKNMPRVLAALKSEISKYNNQALKESNHPIQINGEDFFERVLILESEHGRPNSSRNRNNTSPSKPTNSARVSPSKAISPNGVSNRRPRQLSRSPNKVSPAKLSPTKDNHVTKPSLKRQNERRYTNPTKLRLANALNSTLSSSSSISSLESPRTTLTNSSLHTLGSAQLLPLNSPLKLNHNSHLHNDKRRKNIEENFQLKDLPLQPNQNVINTSRLLSNKLQSSFLDKENSSPTLYSPGQFDSKIYGASKQFEDTQRISIITGDSSGFLETDYQNWRSERIKQMNN